MPRTRRFCQWPAISAALVHTHKNLRNSRRIHFSAFHPEEVWLGVAVSVGFEERISSQLFELRFASFGHETWEDGHREDAMKDFP